MKKREKTRLTKKDQDEIKSILFSRTQCLIPQTRWFSIHSPRATITVVGTEYTTHGPETTSVKGVQKEECCRVIPPVKRRVKRLLF